MSLFKPAQNTMAYLKMGVMGEAGSGKTHTSTLVGIGLIKYLRERKIEGAERPAFMLDTENGSSWIKPMFEEAGIDLLVAKTRAFKDLVPAVREAEKSASLLLIDSVTHFWEELKDSYLAVLSERRKRAITDLEFQDWAYIKGQWKKFSDAFVVSNLHCILCGRLGWEYDQTTNDRGRKQIEKSGVKMQAEKGLGYEPNILVWMERDMDLQSKVTTRTATILKDRSRRLDGKQFEQPSFATFLPHVEFMALGGKHEGVDVTRSSEDVMPDDETKRDTTSLRREIEVELIQATFVEHIPGQTAADKQRKMALLQECFNTKSWTEIEKLMPLEHLREGHAALKAKLSPAAAAPPAPAVEPAAVLDDAQIVLRDQKQEAARLINAIAQAPNRTRLLELIKKRDPDWPAEVAEPVLAAAQSRKAQLALTQAAE